MLVVGHVQVEGGRAKAQRPPAEVKRGRRRRWVLQGRRARGHGGVAGSRTKSRERLERHVERVEVLDGLLVLHDETLVNQLLRDHLANQRQRRAHQRIDQFGDLHVAHRAVEAGAGIAGFLPSVSWTSDSLTGASAPHTLPIAAKCGAMEFLDAMWLLHARTRHVRRARVNWKPLPPRTPLHAARALDAPLATLPRRAEAGAAARERRAGQVDAPRARPADDAPPLAGSTPTRSWRSRRSTRRRARGARRAT